MRRIYSDTFFCHTRRTSQPKMPYIYLINGPDLFRYLFLPHQRRLAAENALNSPKKYPDQKNYLRRPRQEHSRARNHYKTQAKQGHATKATFLKENPEPTGNPLKNPKKQHKKPLPPPVAGWAGRAGLGWVGWGKAGLGWLG